MNILVAGTSEGKTSGFQATVHIQVSLTHHHLLIFSIHNQDLAESNESTIHGCNRRQRSLFFCCKSHLQMSIRLQTLNTRVCLQVMNSGYLI
jgi:hypothetical protein